MYFGAPSGPGGKFYHGRSDDTAWNRDLNWRLRVSTENKRLETELKVQARYKRSRIRKKVQKEFGAEDVKMLINAVRKHGPEPWNVVLRAKCYEPLWKYNERQLRNKWQEIEKTRKLAMHVTLTSIPQGLAGSASAPGQLPGVPAAAPVGSKKQKKLAQEQLMMSTLESAGMLSSHFAEAQRNSGVATGQAYSANDARQLAAKLKAELEQEKLARQRLNRALSKEKIGRAVAEKRLADSLGPSTSSTLGRLPAASPVSRPGTHRSALSRSIEAPAGARPSTALSLASCSSLAPSEASLSRRALLERKLQSSRGMRSNRSIDQLFREPPPSSSSSSRAPSGVASGPGVPSEPESPMESQ